MKNKRTIILIAATLILIAAYVFWIDPMLSKKSVSQPSFNVSQEAGERQVVTWNGVNVGRDSLAEVESKYGQQIKETPLEGGKTLRDLDWKSKYVPFVVGTESDNTVTYIEVPQALTDKPLTYQELVDTHKLQKPEATLYVPGSMYTRVDVYPKKGLAFEYQIETKEILRVMYFSPINLQDYLKTWGSKFSITQPQQWN